MDSGKVTDWIELIRANYALANTASARRVEPVFLPPATREQIEKAEQQLGAVFPDDLVNLLLATDGVRERLLTASGMVDTGYFLFSIQRMLDTNALVRKRAGDYTMPLDCLLFFAGDGSGGYFGYAVISGRVPHSRIYFWDHEDDSRCSIAPSLAYFIENWLNGRKRV